MKLITYDTAGVFKLYGGRNPYRADKLWEFSEGVYDDMILMDGDPFKGIKLVSG